MNKRLLTIILCLLFPFMHSASASAKEFPDWESYPSLFSVNDLTVYKGNIYGVCTNGMFAYNVESREYTYYYRDNGLEKNNLNTIVTANDFLYIGSQQDGLMRFDPETEEFADIIFPEYVDLDDPQNTIEIKDIYVMDENVLLVAHDRGIDMINIKTENIRTFSKLSARITQDTAVNHVYIFNGKIWACTDEGLAWADADNPNLESESEWESVGFGAPITAMIPTVIEGDTLFYLGTSRKGIKLYNPDTIFGEDTSVMKGIVTDFVKLNDSIYASVMSTTETAGLYRLVGNTWFARTTYEDLNSLVTYEDQVFVGAAYDGLLCVITSGYWKIPEMNFPKASNLRNIDISDDGTIWTTTSNRDIHDDHPLLQKYHEGKWIYYSPDEGDEIPSRSTTSILASSHGPVWAATWGEGLYAIFDNGTPEKNDDDFLEIDPLHEIIIEYEPDAKFYVCPDIKEDIYGNIWVAGFTNGAFVFEGELPVADYKHYRYEVTDYVMNVTPDTDGWVWLGTWSTGVYGIQTGDDPFDGEDDITRHVSVPEGLLGYRIAAIHPDKDGDVWVGSDGGLNLIEKQTGNKLQVKNENTLIGGSGVSVLSIEVDPYNTKWIGTTAGLVKISANNEYIETYTPENCPILSTIIWSVKYDEENDQLLIGTDSGMNKLQVVKKGNGSDEASAFHMYPNPFEIWGYNSQAVFTDLKPGETVRIFTFNGELVNELETEDPGVANGAEALWNGRNFKNEYVNSGVYFFTGMDQNGEEFKEKMVVIRR